ncbi:MAG: D-alanyl-D-alanine carboxypeptidase [Pseudomonadota bacterium]
MRLPAVLVLALALILPGTAGAKDEDWGVAVRDLAKDGAVMTAGADGRVLFSFNPDQPLIPASTLKIVTAAAALTTLGRDYRFTTDFRLSGSGDLYVIGRGDPLLVSEELALIARALKEKGLTRVRDIYLDNGFFEPGLVLHGTARSLKPWDAYNGALCANFNTIFVRVGPDRQVVTAEPQTPLTDMGRKLAQESGLKGEVRFNLAENPETCLLYAGELLKEFLKQAGVEVQGQVAPAKGDLSKIPLYYRHPSSKDLAWVVSQLMEYSNNFIANQVFLTMGAEKYGPPATAEKTRRVVADFLKAHRIPQFHVEEGSGLSRRTTLTARQMIAVLQTFRPYRDLLRNKGSAWHKGGTLAGVKCLAGFFQPKKGEPIAFAIFINSDRVRYHDPDMILKILQENSD